MHVLPHPAAGVLALLVEAGEAQTVVAAGEEWLATHRADPRARDVALSTALAHRAVAQALARKQGDAAAAASMLEVAGGLLRRHRAAPHLQVRIRLWGRRGGALWCKGSAFLGRAAASRQPQPQRRAECCHGAPFACLQAEVAAELAELQPALACQLVALPLERFQERDRGVQVRSAARPGSPGMQRRRVRPRDSCWNTTNRRARPPAPNSRNPRVPNPLGARWPSAC